MAYKKRKDYIFSIFMKVLEFYIYIKQKTNIHTCALDVYAYMRYNTSTFGLQRGGLYIL